MASKTLAQMADGAPAQSTDQIYILRGGDEDFSLTLAELAALISGGGGTVPSSPYHKVAGASNNAASIKASAGVVTGWQITNDTEYPLYVKLYDKAAAPVPGTDTPAQTIGVQAGESAPAPPGPGITYSLGIGIAIVSNIEDADDTPVTANSCVVDIFYQ